jgi:phosphoglycerate dehydrogenase-like enzyme
VVAAARGGIEIVDAEAAREHDLTVLHAPGRNVVERWSGFGPDIVGHDPYVDDAAATLRSARGSSAARHSRYCSTPNSL